MGFIYALRSEQEKTKHTSFWAIHFCVPVMGALLFLAYYSQYASTADSKQTQKYACKINLSLWFGGICIVLSVPVICDWHTSFGNG